MGTTKVGKNTDAPVRPTYEQLLDENRALKRQVEWLTRLVEKLRRQSKAGTTCRPPPLGALRQVSLALTCTPR